MEAVENPVEENMFQITCKVVDRRSPVGRKRKFLIVPVKV